MAQARRKARVANAAAPVYMFADADVTPLGSLTVARDRLQALLPTGPESPPLVLAWCERGPPLRVTKAYAVTSEQWKNRVHATYIGYDSASKKFEFRLDAMPVLPRPHRAVGQEAPEPDEPAPVAAQHHDRPCCEYLRGLDTLWIDRQAIVEWLVADDCRGLSASAAMRYVETSLFMLEQRALITQHLTGPDLAMDRMRHGLAFFFPDMERTRLGMSVAYVATVIVPAILGETSTMDAKARANKGDRRSLADAVRTGNSPAMRLGQAWIATEDTLVNRLLYDPDKGMATCGACARRLLARLEETLGANGDALPWIRALGLVREKGRVCLADATGEGDGASEWYTIPRALAYRLPVDRERLLEDPETGQWRARLETVVQEVVPFIVDKLAHETLWMFFEAAHRSDAPDGFVNAIDVASATLGTTRDYLMGTLGRVGVNAVRHMGEWFDHVMTPETRRRTEEHPIAPTPIPVHEPSADGDPLKWFDALRDQYRDVAMQFPDVEDLVRRDLLPPCMKHAVAESRNGGTMHNYLARFRYAAWMADMGYDEAATVQLSGTTVASDATELAAHVRNVNAHRKPGQCSSFQCKSNMNAPEERATNCVMRRKVLGARDTGGKIADSTRVAEVRRACTATLPGYAHGTWPRYAISHPLDYVVLRMEYEKTTITK